jgi:hypothetical protein
MGRLLRRAGRAAQMTSVDSKRGFLALFSAAFAGLWGK